jgi:hypothetical protein
MGENGPAMARESGNGNRHHRHADISGLISSPQKLEYFRAAELLVRTLINEAFEHPVPFLTPAAQLNLRLGRFTPDKT